MTEEPEGPCWGVPEMIVTVLGVLSAVGVGAWIFWVASGRSSRPAMVPMMGYAPPPPRMLPDVKMRIEQIRGYIRAANEAATPVDGLTNAGSALALLADAESTYGERLQQGCDPDKLRRLITKVQDRYAKTLGPISA